ncbi:hypothetical protein HA402_012337 [Bradysia odoriphaga]|nr:hypothetical protein HA402_012337 [Bradysia odoriphaga]
MHRPNGDMPSTSNQHNNADFIDDIDLPNLVDSDEPELRQLDDIDEKKNVVAKADILSIILSKYGDDGIKLEESFRLYKIEYKDLASLSDNDLKQFGVADAQKRRLILNDFSEMLHQNDHYDKELDQLNLEEYGFDGLNNIRKHLYFLKLAITGSLLKLEMHPAEDIYVSNELNASELVLRTLEEMKRTSNVMENQLLRLSAGKKYIKNEMKMSKRLNCWKLFLMIGATAISGVILFKYYRTKVFKF